MRASGDSTEIRPDIVRAMQLVAEALGRVKYGTVTVTIHDGTVTDVVTAERTRLSPQK